jgi:hypothetical protein
MVREGVVLAFTRYSADYLADKHELGWNGVGFRRTIAQPLWTIGLPGQCSAITLQPRLVTRYIATLHELVRGLANPRRRATDLTVRSSFRNFRSTPSGTVQEEGAASTVRR